MGPLLPSGAATVRIFYTVTQEVESSVNWLISKIFVCSCGVISSEMSEIFTTTGFPVTY